MQGLSHVASVLLLSAGVAGVSVAVAAAAEQHPVSMVVEAPKELKRPGIVVGAPHDGWDMHTGDIARALAKDLGVPVVVAKNYRKPTAGRWHDVNRPTTRTVDSEGKRGPEQITESGRATFAKWLAKVREAAGAAKSPKPPVPLYIEVHGNVRKVEVEGKQVPCSVIEVATRGFDVVACKRLKALWAKQRDKAPGLPPLVFDVTDRVFEYRSTKVKFYWVAGGARRHGILRDEHVRRFLHFELPASARSTTARRIAVAAAVAKVVASVR